MKKKKMGKGMDILFEYNSLTLDDTDSLAEEATDEAASPEGTQSIPPKSAAEKKGGITTLRTTQIEPDRKQPRTEFSEEAIAELTQSVEEHGVLQPLLVRPKGDGYMIVAGERRWRAAMRAGLKEIPVVIREMTDLEAAQIALIENLQRESLNPIEEARGYKRLIDEFSMTQEQVARQVSKSRSVIANSLRLLNLQEEILSLLADGKISVGHAKVLAGLENEEFALLLARKTADESLSVRELERLSALGFEKVFDNNKLTINKEIEKIVRKDSYCDEIALSLSEYFSQKVKVTMKKNGGAQLKIDFRNVEELKKLASELARRADAE